MTKELDEFNLKHNKKIELDNIRHKQILEEIEAMKKAKITSFVR